MAGELKTIDATTASDLLEEGALLVDVREAGEYAQARIPGSVNVALSEFETSDIPAEGQPIVYFCQSGNRTRVHAARLAAKGDAYVLGGGIIEWAQAGLPIERG